MKKTIITLALTATLGLTACGSTGGSSTDSPSSGTNAPSSSTTEDTDIPDMDENFEDVEAVSETLTFGETFTYEDGLQITVSKPKEITLGEWADNPGETAAAFEVTYVNGTGAPFDASLTYATVQSGNTEAEEEYYDPDNNLDGAPSTSILADREAKFTIAYVPTDMSDMVMEISPDAGIDYAPILFETK